VSARPTRIIRIAVISPWGSGGGYSGPVMFMNRLWRAVKESRPDLFVTLVYRHRRVDERPDWADSWVPGVTSDRFGRLEQIKWILRVSWWVCRNRRRYDIVHLHGAYLTNLVPAVFARRGTVVLVPVLEGGDLSGERAVLKSLVTRFVARRVKAGFALSDGIAHEMRRAGVPAESVERIVNPVASSMLLASDQEVPQRPRVRIGFVGKVGPLKNPELLIEAAALVEAAGFECEIHYFGPFATPAYEASLRGMGRGASVKGVVNFHGFTSDLLAAFRAFDVFVLPSAKEGLPGALCEALAMGKPVVVTDVGSMGEIVRASGGGFVVEPSAADVAAAIIRLQEPGLASEIGRSGREYARAQLSPAASASVYSQKVFSDESV